MHELGPVGWSAEPLRFMHMAGKDEAHLVAASRVTGAAALTAGPEARRDRNGSKPTFHATLPQSGHGGAPRAGILHLLRRLTDETVYISSLRTKRQTRAPLSH